MSDGGGKERTRGKYRDRDDKDRSRDRDRREERAKPYAKFTDTNSSDPALVNSRVFIGNLPSDRTDRQDLLDIFEKYGKILAVSVLTGYGFIQFAHEDDAREAVENEKGGHMNGSKIDVKMAAEGRKKSGSQSGSSGRRGGSPSRRSSPPPRRRNDPYERRDDRRRLPPSPPPRDRELYDRRDPYGRDRYPLPPLPPLPPPVDILPPPLPSIHLFRPPYECEIILSTPNLRGYADSIEDQLKPHGMVVQHNVVNSEAEVPKAVEELTRLKVPYAVIISEQNESHRSITLNILHGTPQGG